ncbi:aminotransferase class I/II-fold pyridoxal phosphate-dependent enzyme [Chitiniphilus purpureus]|uniref:Aminotransferase n=1 Tax=Chitiniphilus purpureus TaxID=2981137 RepID=A0ABY6DP45_9NEIS|nr:aminotransferase class I/II-fold pyridoxal phosphate-dependent enzyme [Chitiniphilus sp. CD1]UXY15797.1 aminotransferase class I/II-fold pyridoxal phosphate-dependent enzyme [Chitiniphilus sp. CD1]
MLSQRANLISGSKTSGMRNLAARLKAEGKPVVNFAAGELDDNISDVVKHAAIQAVIAGNNKYTETIGIPELRQAIAIRLSQQTGLDWSADEVAVTAGAKQALFNTAMMLFNPGDEVIIPAPYWTTFPTQIRLTGALPIFVDTALTGYVLDSAAIAEKISQRTKAIVLNTPNNPTGSVIHADVLGEIAALAEQHGLWVIFDQCYSDFVYAEAQHLNILQIAPNLRSRVVIIDSFSKSHALAGWRVGYAAAPKALTAACSNLQSHTTSNPNAIAQIGALAALEHYDSRYHEKVLARLNANRQLGLQILQSLRDVEVITPEGGFYFYLNIRCKINGQAAEGQISNCAQLVEHLLANAQVAVVGGEAFGDLNGLRISYAINESDLEQGLWRIVNCLNAIVEPR